MILIGQAGLGWWYGGSLATSGSPVLSSSSGSFGIDALTPSLRFPAGSSSTSDINLTSIGGFKGTVTLSATVSNSSLHNIPTVTLNPASLQLAMGGMNTSILTVFTVTSTPPGSYTVTVTGTSGTLTNSTAVAVKVQAFSMSANPSSFSLTEGYSAMSTVTLTSLAGFSGNVSLSSLASPSGLTISLSRSWVLLTTTANSTLTISTSSSTPTGLYTVTITGAFGPLVESVLVKVTVTGFAFSANPSVFSLSAGSSASSNISLNSINGFAGTVNLGVNVSPPGTSASLSVSSVIIASGGSAPVLLSISTSSSTVAGFYTVNVTGVSGLQVHSLFVPVAVGHISVSINNVTTFTNITVRTNGTLTVDSPSNTLTVSGLVSVNATYAAIHALLFMFTYNVTRLPILAVGAASYRAIFLLDVPVSPYHLSSDVTVAFSGTTATATVGVTRNVDIDLDGIVNKADSDIVAASNGCSSNMLCYNPRADLYATGTVNLLDLTLIVLYYGATDFKSPVTANAAGGGGGVPPLRS